MPHLAVDLLSQVQVSLHTSVKTYNDLQEALADLKSESLASPFPYYALEQNKQNTLWRIKPLLSVYPAYVHTIAINGVLFSKESQS